MSPATSSRSVVALPLPSAATITPAAPGLGDAAHTLTSARASFSYRRAVVAQDPRRASEDLRARAGLAGTAPGRGLNRQVILVMPGQGTQRPGMARPYLDALPGFGYVLEQVLDGLADVVTVQRARERSVSCPGIEGPDNLAWRALDALEAEAACALPVAVRIVKAIPAQAGLGGGSSSIRSGSRIGRV